MKGNRRRITWILSMLLIANSYIIGISFAEEGNSESTGETRSTEPLILDTITTTVQIDAGDYFYLYYNPEDFKLVAEPPYNLPDECDIALEMVPEWLRSNLSYKFRQLSSDYRTTFANLIINSPEEKYIDEIAFSIAHSAVENLEDDYFFPELLTHNAQLIYENDLYLNYVEVVERKNYTTVVYKDKDNLSVEAPKDIYYWSIVLPKLSDELATYVDPDHDFTSDPPINEKNYGVPPPTGKFWRDWLFYYNDSGYPLLKDYLGQAWTLWEAISKCNSWMSGSMSFTSDNERPIQPVRIYRKHIGRCGEYQDMRNAIARAGLIPSTCACNIAEDHVWNEFWDKRWIHWDGTVDNPMMYENGWGKKISSVWNTRGDSDIWSVTEKYTLICNYTATVLDESELPVDGALVRVLTENYYYPDDLLSTTTWGTTDYTGTVTIPLGDERNFWSSAESETLGNDPLNGVTQVISNSEAGADYSYTFHLPLSAEPFRGTEASPPSVVDPKYRIEVNYEVEANIVNVKNYFSEEMLGESEHGDFYGSSGNVDFFIADFINYNQYMSDLPFSAHNINEKSSSGDIAFILPYEDRYYAVFSNEFSQASTMIVNITANLVSDLQVEFTSPQTGSELNIDNVVHITGTSWGHEGIDLVEIDMDYLGSWEQAIDTSGSGMEPYSTWEFYLDTKGLTPGEHKILAKASSGENSCVSWININLIDVTNPTVSIENPIQNSGYRLGSLMKINGTVSDNVGIQTLELIIDSDELNATDITKFLSDNFFSYELETYELVEGEHTISVRAYDTSDNSDSDTRNIRILETIDPNVRIRSPSPSSILKLGETIEISGFATDNLEITSLEIQIDDKTPKSIFDDLEDDGDWSYNWITQSLIYTDGWYFIEVKATDSSENTDSHKIKVFLDGTPPELNINLPKDNKIFKAQDTISIEGTASDEMGIDSIRLQLDNGEPVDITDTLRNGKWYHDYWETSNIKSGEHIIRISVTDTAGHISEETIIMVMDNEEPVVEIDQLTTTTEKGDIITLSGTVSDDIGIKEITLVIDYDEEIDITETLVNGSWEYQLDTSGISEGSHTISVIVTDNVENQVSHNFELELGEDKDGSDGSADEDTFNIEFMVLLILLTILSVLILVVSSKSKRNKT